MKDYRSPELIRIGFNLDCVIAFDNLVSGAENELDFEETA